MSSVSPKSVAPKGQKKCGVCGLVMSMLDPHTACVRCVPRTCSRDLPCEACSPLNASQWDAWEEQASKTKPYSSRQKPKPKSSKGPSTGTSTKIKKVPVGAPSKVGGRVDEGDPQFDALSSRVDRLASTVESLLKVLSNTPSAAPSGNSSTLASSSGVAKSGGTPIPLPLCYGGETCLTTSSFGQ